MRKGNAYIKEVLTGQGFAAKPANKMAARPPLPELITASPISNFITKSVWRDKKQKKIFLEFFPRK
jgi:hypothetical protein